MHFNKQKLIRYCIELMPVLILLSISFFISGFYIDKVKSYFTQLEKKTLEEYIKVHKDKSELKIEQLMALFEATNKSVEPEIKERLQKKVQNAHLVAHAIYNKYKNKKSKRDIQGRIKDTFSHLLYNEEGGYIFVRDYNANEILDNRNYVNKELALYRDADNRAIVLEEIQKVRKYGEGFLKSRDHANNNEEIIFVQNLALYDWYIGSREELSISYGRLQVKLLEDVKNIPRDSSEYIGVFKEKEKIYSSHELDGEKLILDGGWHKFDEKYIYTSRYFAPFEWTIVFGFELTEIQKKSMIKQKQLTTMLQEEQFFITIVTLLVAGFMLLVTIVLLLQIDKHLKHKRNHKI